MSGGEEKGAKGGEEKNVEGIHRYLTAKGESVLKLGRAICLGSLSDATLKKREKSPGIRGRNRDCDRFWMYQ